jgi:hypothetical protein
MFFFEKKAAPAGREPKNFYNLALVRFSSRGQIGKSSLFFLSRKKNPSLTQPQQRP